MTSGHDAEPSSSITTTGDLEYAMLVFSTNLHHPIDLNCSICNHSFETEMMRDCPLLVVMKSVHLFHFVKLCSKLRFNLAVDRLSFMHVL